MSLILSQTQNQWKGVLLKFSFWELLVKYIYQAVYSNGFDRNNQWTCLGYFMCLCMSWGVCVHLYSNGLKILCTKPQKYTQTFIKIKTLNFKLWIHKQFPKWKLQQHIFIGFEFVIWLWTYGKNEFPGRKLKYDLENHFLGNEFPSCKLKYDPENHFLGNEFT